MRQLERNILIRLGANERIWTPALDRALAAISEVAPIRERDAGPLLVQRGIATSPNFSVAGLVLAAETFHRALPVWDISLPIHIPLRHLFQPRAIAAELAQVSRQARVLASRQGVATIAQVHAFITSLGLAFEMVAIAPILRARPGLIWIDQDRFTAPNEAANPLALWVRKLVALQSGLSLEQIAEAIGRNPEAYAPEVDDLRAFLAWHEDFDVRDDLVFPAREFVASAILSPSEAKLVALFRRHGPVLSPTDAGRLGRAEGMPAEKTYKLLHSSPLIRRLARGQYTLFYLDPDASA
jgi:hypothetical protein